MHEILIESYNSISIAVIDGKIISYRTSSNEILSGTGFFPVISIFSVSFGSFIATLSADFMAIPTEGYAPLTVSFTDESTGSPTSWLWYFGDGTSSADQNPVHVYADPGTYSVTLTVSDGVDSDTETKIDYIYSKIMIDAVPRFGIAPLEVIFSTSYTGTSYLWDFGDGITSTEASPKHTYTAVGNYTISLSITDSHGNIIPAYEPYFISVSKLDFGVYPDKGKLPLSVQFSNRSASPTGCEFSHFYWNFGDNTAGYTGYQVTHTYRNKGKYTPTLNGTLTRF